MKRNNEASPSELFRVEGVGAKGFGIIPRYAMCDPELSWAGKVLYAYLCALAGSGNQAWPRRETVVHCLGISKDTYYRGQRELIELGYISVTSTRRRNRQGVNIYTLVSNPPKLRNRPTDATADTAMQNRVIARGLKAGGYGMLPRLVMQDERLCAKTKLVYAYLSSYAGAGCSAFPTTAVALSQLSFYKEAWRKGIRELTQCGYIEVVQRRVKGRFDVYDYILLETPQRKRKKAQPETGKKDTEPGAGKKDAETSPETGNRDAGPETGKKDTETPPETGNRDAETSPEAGNKDAEPEAGNKDAETSPVSVNRDTEPELVNKDTETPPEAGLPDAGNKDTRLVTVLTSNIYQSIYQQRQDETTQNPDSGDRWMDYETVKCHLSEQLKLTSEKEANAVYGPQAQGAFELLNLLADTLAGSGKTFLIGKQEKPKEVLWKLTPEHLRYVMDSVRSQQKRIYNVRAYLLAALYHATETCVGNQLIQSRRTEQAEERRQSAEDNQREIQALLSRLTSDD